MQIRNSIFLVTGGASGLGAATARMAAENGGKVVIADLQVEAGERLAKELGGRFAKTDVSNEADGKAAVALAVITRAGYQQGFSLPRVPQRGSGSRAAPARLGSVLPR